MDMSGSLIKTEVSSPLPPPSRSPPSPHVCSPILHKKCGVDPSPLPLRPPPPLSGTHNSCFSPLGAAGHDIAVADNNYLKLHFQLKQGHEMHKQLLFKHYQEEQLQMEKIQEHELHMHFEQQKSLRAEEERQEKQRLEQRRLEDLKKKDKTQHSAVPSPEVKQKLHDFILNKYGSSSGVGVGLPGFSAKNWHAQRSLDKGSPPSLSNAASTSSHPYRLNSSDDLTLRKSASEPNISLKKNVLPKRTKERSLASRKEKLSSRMRRIPAYSAVDTGSTPDSGQSSPHNGLPASRSSSGSTPIHEEESRSPFGGLTQGPDLALYPSPSMPNIPLGRLPYSAQMEGMKLSVLSEAELQPQGIPGRMDVPMLNSSGHIFNSTLHYYPTLPVINSEDHTSSNLSPSSSRHQIITDMDTSGSPGPPLTNLMHHPLGLPAGMQLPENLRQTVLTRSSSKNQVENVEEETESALAQANAPEVIVVEERKMDLSEVMSHHESAYLHHDRRLAPHLLRSPVVYAHAPKSGSHIARPLARANSSPLVTLNPSQESLGTNKHVVNTGLVYDSLMEKHQCQCGMNSNHPENSGRLQVIWRKLQDTNLINRCHRVHMRRAIRDEILSCHSEEYLNTLEYLSERGVMNVQGRPLNSILKNMTQLECGGIGMDSDTVWNKQHTYSAAVIAVGCVIELAFKVARGDIKNGYALVRPPGHHSEEQQAMGFCFFNNVAIAAKQLKQKLNIEKILIVDWDVHHGNGTQSMCYDDPHILYISIHRYDDGSFFPGTGSYKEVGEGDGCGFNVNIAWSGGLNPPMGDAEYMAAFRCIVMPIAKDFSPDIVLVSAGFDAADGHVSQLGGYRVTPNCFAHMTKELMSLAGGKVVLALEGGYDISVISDCTVACLSTLLGDDPLPLASSEITRPPCPNAIETLRKVVDCQMTHWPIVQRHTGTITMSIIETRGREQQEETLSAMASLQVDPQLHASGRLEPCVVMPTNEEEEPMEDMEIKWGRDRRISWMRSFLVLPKRVELPVKDCLLALHLRSFLVLPKRVELPVKECPLACAAFKEFLGFS